MTSAKIKNTDYARGYYEGYANGRMSVVEEMAKHDLNKTTPPTIAVSIKEINDQDLLWQMIKCWIRTLWRKKYLAYFKRITYKGK